MTATVSRFALFLFLLAAAVFGQANPVQRVKLYSGVPTAGDCTTNTVGTLVGLNTTASPDGIYDCIETSSSPAWVARGSSAGTVTSVDLTFPSALGTVSGNPVTSSGTLAISLSSQTQNRVFASPNGSSGTPTFRALVSADIPDLSATYQPLDSDLTAIGGLSPSRGALIRRGVAAWENVALGSSGAILQSDGTDAVWSARVSGASTIDFASVPDGSCLESTFALTGAALGDPVALGVGTALPAGVKAMARVSAADTAEVQVCNMSGAAVDLSSRSWTVRVVR